ncbi:unnamed protein product [Lepeophtheirus salmonis]|uniref:(salmon louse) hypothetical protein n=1 Tax=Lepeophtheirus salmonis TaxID=72036 RepID=A0A7R8CTB5_LEPSM|nr:unnamed protein product [Lepeophtheirus salmonis]CAF2924509.1 unnamed protein product [Lepeophtheirus salmonis]
MSGNELFTNYVVLRFFVGIVDVCTDFIRGSSLLFTQNLFWGLLTFALPVFSTLVSIVYGALDKNISFCNGACYIFAKYFEAFLSAGPQLFLFSTSIICGVHFDLFNNIGDFGSSGGFISFLEIFSFIWSILSFSIAAFNYDKESFPNSFLRSITYMAHTFLVSIVPTLCWFTSISSHPLLCLTSESKDWECVLYAFSSLFSPIGYARRRSVTPSKKLSGIVSQSGVKIAKVNLESLVQRLKLFLALFHCLSLASFIILREVVYVPPVILYIFSVCSSLVYLKTVVKARDATRLWDSITPAHPNIELQPVNILPAEDPTDEKKGTPGNSRCDGKDRECVTCELMIVGSSFRSSMTGREYKFMNSVSCTTKNVIYLVTCNKCRKQYVGKTEQQFKQRHYGHRREIETKVSPLGKHFAEECGYINWRFQIIDHCDASGDLTRREGYWQQELNTYAPHGLNSRREKL